MAVHRSAGSAGRSSCCSRSRVVTFFLTYVLPADPARMIAGLQATPEDVDRIRHALGLDRPFLVQLGRYLGRLVQGDFGHSYHPEPGRPAARSSSASRRRSSWPSPGCSSSSRSALPLGVLAATQEGQVVRSRVDDLDDHPRLGAGVLGRLPAARLPGLPAADEPDDRRSSRSAATSPGPALPVLPALTLGFGGAAYYTRLTRTAMIEELTTRLRPDRPGQGRAASAASCWRHAFRNADRPDPHPGRARSRVLPRRRGRRRAVFSWPGIGKLAVDSIVTADVPLIMGTVLFATLCIVLANLVVDIVQRRWSTRGSGLRRPMTFSIVARDPVDRRPGRRRPVQVPRGRRGRAVGAGRRRGGGDPGVRQRRLRSRRARAAGRRRDRRGGARRGWSPADDLADERQVGIVDARGESATPHRAGVLRLGRRPDRRRLRGPGQHPGRPGGRGRPGRHVPRRRPAVPGAARRMPGGRRRGRRRPTRRESAALLVVRAGRRLRRRQRPLDRPAGGRSRRPDRRARAAPGSAAPLLRPAAGRRPPAAGCDPSGRAPGAASSGGWGSGRGGR